MEFRKKPDPIIVDLPQVQLEREFKYFDFLSLTHSAGFEIEKSVRRKVRATKSVLERDDAASYLARLIPLAVEETVRTHSPYGRMRWLWYLRRVPSELMEGEYSTTFGYDRALAEAITWAMPESEVERTSPWIHFPVNRSVCRHICQFIGRVKFISNLHTMYRRVGKGAYLDLRGRHIKAINDEETDRAISLYDQRRSEANAIFGQAYGLSPHEFDIDQLRAVDKNGNLKLSVVMPCRPIEVPVDHTNAENGMRKPAVVRARHIPWTIDGKSLLDPLDLGDEWEHIVVRPVSCLLQMSIALPLFMMELERALVNCLKTGYFIVDEARAKRIMDRALPEINTMLSSWFSVQEWPETYTQWRDAAFRFVPQAWPLEPGGFLRPVGQNSILMDAVTMSLALNSGLRLDRSQSKVANVRAGLFEEQVQLVVDQSLWIPSEEISRLRGKPLRRDRRHLTDIDALGAIGDTLLCISCKSVVYDPNYDIGDYRVIQNNKSRIDEAAQDWSTLMENLRAQPKGDNFDFTSFSKIIGVVCTPFVVYTDNAEAFKEIAPGLRACVSVGELRTWLSAGGYTP